MTENLVPWACVLLLLNKWLMELRHCAADSTVSRQSTARKTGSNVAKDTQNSNAKMLLPAYSESVPPALL